MSFFKNAADQRRALDAGKYRIEIVAGSADTYRTQQTGGVSYEVRVVEPKEHADRVVRLRAIADGPSSLDGKIARDMDVLAKWSEGVDTAPAEDLAGAMCNLWIASKDRRVWLHLGHDRGRDGVIELVAVGVDVEPADVV